MGASESKGVGSGSEVVTYKKPELPTLMNTFSSISEPVLVGTVPLTGIQLHRLISTVIGIGKISQPFLDNLKHLRGISPYLDEILDISLIPDQNSEYNVANPEQIQVQVEEILGRLYNDGNLSEFDKICKAINGILENLSPIFSDWISIFITGEDTDKIIRELIDLGAHESLALINSFYNSIPIEAQEVMRDQASIQKFLQQTLKDSRKIVSSKTGVTENGDITQQAVGTVYGYLGQILLSKVLEEQYRPQIKPASKVLAKVIPLTFALLSINKYCTNSEEIGPIGIEQEQQDVTGDITEDAE